MKTLLFFAGLLALAWALKVPVYSQRSSTRTKIPLPPSENVGQEASFRQTVALNLLQYINQPSYSPEIEKIGLTYDIQANIQSFRNPHYVAEFFNLYSTSALPKGQIFSIFYPQHQQEAIAFFRILYNAIDFDTFYRTAAWGRMFLNEGLYIYALSVALVHRPDTYSIQLPPIYEIYPYYFYNVDVFQQVQQQTGLPLGSYEYLRQYNVSSWPYEYGQKSYKYPYYFGKYSTKGIYQVPPQYQQGHYQYQQGPNQYQQGPYQSHQGPYQSQQGLYQSQQRPYQYQRPYSQQYYPNVNRILKPHQRVALPPNVPHSQESLQQSQYPYQSYEQLQQDEPQQQVPYGLYPEQYVPVRQLHSYSPNLSSDSYQRSLSGDASLEYLNNIISKLIITKKREKVPLKPFYETSGVTIEANYTQYFPGQNPENRLSYFTEDVGLNAFYYYYNIFFPFWLSNDEIYFNTERRGEQFYYIYQQLLARYNLERISNGLQEIPILDIDSLIPTGYTSGLVYPNGASFPSRPSLASTTPRIYQGSYDNYTLGVFNYILYEQRLLDAIDSGFVLSRDGKLVSLFEPKGFEILGNLIQSNPQSPNVRYYGNILGIARYILGNANYSIDQYNITPSVLEQYETSLRDSAFYQLSKRIIYYFQRYKQYLPTYSQNDLLVSGVRIQDVKVDRLVTYFDYFYSDVSNAVTPQTPSQEVPIQVRQYRLNHRAFNYYLNVESETPYEAVVRVYLGPKYNLNDQPININKDRMNFVELDRFQYSLTPGLNVIERNSREFFGYIPDRTTYRELFLQLINYQTTPVEVVPRIQWGIPQRLLLPRGTKEGQVYQMYIIITPYQPVQKYLSKKVQSQQPELYWDVTYDNLPYGYPFDRPIDESVFYVPNSYFQDVVIYNEFNPTPENGQKYQSQKQYPYQSQYPSQNQWQWQSPYQSQYPSQNQYQSILYPNHNQYQYESQY